MTTPLQERAAKLRHRVNQDYAPVWDFAELPEIVGVVETLKRVTIDGVDKVVATIAEVDGEDPQRHAVWLSQRALYNQFVELDIREGELVAIRYLGVSDKAQPGQSPAKRFRVEVDRGGSGSGTFSWSATDAPDPSTDHEITRSEHEAIMDEYHGRQQLESEERQARGGTPDEEIPY